jgi:hypothetical protein
LSTWKTDFSKTFVFGRNVITYANRHVTDTVDGELQKLHTPGWVLAFVELLGVFHLHAAFLVRLAFRCVEAVHDVLDRDVGTDDERENMNIVKRIIDHLRRCKRMRDEQPRGTNLDGVSLLAPPLVDLQFVIRRLSLIFVILRRLAVRPSVVGIGDGRVFDMMKSALGGPRRHRSIPFAGISIDTSARITTCLDWAGINRLLV